MATPAVQAASCAGAATAVITTTVVVVPTADAMPKYNPYSADTDFNGNSSKIGKDLYPFLINHKDEENKDWWEWSFRQLTAHKENKLLNDAFKNLTSGFKKEGTGDQNSKELNQFCYYHFKNTDTSSTDAATQSIWKYCSPLGKPPLTIENAKEASNYKENLGKTKALELISLNGNFLFWELKNTWFKKQSIEDAFFKPLKENKEKTLKDACEKVYSTTAAANGSSGTATATQPKETDAVKYCGFKVT